MSSKCSTKQKLTKAKIIMLISFIYWGEGNLICRDNNYIDFALRENYLKLIFGVDIMIRSTVVPHFIASKYM